jgi:outer membrane protein, adhesin transport system
MNCRGLAQCLAMGALALLAMPEPAAAMSLKDAVQQAVATHPSVDALRAGRRATGWDVKAAQSRFLPSLDVHGDAGAQYVDKPNSLSADNNAEWRARRQVTGTVTQVLFNGWERANNVYRHAARFDAASYRVMEQSEALGLDAVEAYIDVRRHLEILAVAQRNRARMQQIAGLVLDLREGGRVPQSDVDQTGERLAAADAVTAQIRQALEEATAKFRQVVGTEPANLSAVGLPPALPASRDAAFQVSLDHHPRLQATAAEARAAEFAREQARSGHLPTISLQGSASYGSDLDGIPGRNADVTGKVVLTWNLFDGFATSYRTKSLSEQFNRAQFDQQTAARQIRESVDRAFAAWRMGGERVAATRRQVEASQSLARQYEDEYTGGRRSLLDLLDAENAVFTSRFQLASVSAVQVFAAYQLLATMGRLLATLGIHVPPEARGGLLHQTDRGPLGLDFEIEPLRK